MKQPMTNARKQFYLNVWIFAILLLAVSLTVFWVSKPVSIHFVDVGQGDACLVRGGQGGTVLIDGGDVGEGKTLLSYFAKQNVRKLDAVILSHLHDDHISGVKELIQEGFPITELYLSPITDHQAEQELLALTKDAKISVTYLSAEETLNLGKVTYKVLWPYPKAEYMKENNQSMVLRLEYGKNRILLTGDVELSAQAELAMNMGEELKADVLKVPHHGGKTAVYPPFLTKVQPKIGIISVGVDNYHGHPHPDMLSALEETGCGILRTDLHGTVSVILHKDRLARIETNEKWRLLQ
ncbi:MAG: MBL fold metallo-hydrolase [Clostridia bacterium]|nr:MBL fold metallo-hydrolase [Clostridia bacterium]